MKKVVIVFYTMVLIMYAKGNVWEDPPVGPLIIKSGETKIITPGSIYNFKILLFLL